MKKYQIIYADPAWLYQCGKNHLAKKSMINGKTDIHYNAMPIKEMEQMKINEIADNDCLLFMWITSPFLKIGIDLIFPLLVLCGIKKKQILALIHFQNAKFV